MSLTRRLFNSIKFRTRYFLFSKKRLPSTSFASLIFETLIQFLNSKLAKTKGVSLSVSIKPLGELETYVNADFAIILHGKILDENFLARNIRQLRKMCPESPIILSTYVGGISPKLSAACKDEGVFVTLLDEPPQLPPPYAANLARAVASTFNGMTAAYNMGAKTALKLRVDQEITRTQGLKVVDQLLAGKIFPGLGAGRIVGTSYNSYKQLPLFLSDMLHIGNVSDLLKYWEPFNAADIDHLTKTIFADADEFLSHWKAVPEVWLAARYMHNLGNKVGDAAETNLEFWSNHAAVVDSTSLGQNWLKSIDCLDANYSSIKWFEESFHKQYLELRFSDWLVLVLESRGVNYGQADRDSKKKN